MRASRRRGQAMAEMVLGLMIFVTVVAFGIHFAEVGYLSLRVHEAAVSPLWDATALRVHKMMPNEDKIGDFSMFPNIAPAVTRDANARYRDFDGRRSSNNSSSITHVFTRIDSLEVQCEVDDRVEFDVPRSLRPILMVPQQGDWNQGDTTPDLGNATDSVLDGVYENVGGVSCTANARLQTLPSLTTTFLEGDSGFFKEQHAVLRDMKACASGRAINGECKGRYAILLGDFAFADTDVSGQCPLRPEQPDVPCGENPAYYYGVRKVFDNNDRSAGRDASDFARVFVGYSPIDESGFFMSYRGEEDDYQEPDTPAGEALDAVDRDRNTGGVPDRPAKRRPSKECFLGLLGC
ncbi:hypothetical protein [Hyalangium minutum]|nr:hypothetical protein [Hyalangium minutum]